jgi:hypothetical protein
MPLWEGIVFSWQTFLLFSFVLDVSSSTYGTFTFSWILLWTMANEAPQIYSGVEPRDVLHRPCLFKPQILPDIGSVWLNSDGWDDIRGTK